MTYLHLVDLKTAMLNVATDRPVVLLDYGCGGYRSLFPNADYRRADFVERDCSDVTYPLSLDGTIAERDATFDVVLSTQVLEHVKSPSDYLSKCYRLLKSGGQLYLTTHGTYPDHGCPADYRRWTDGLAEDVPGAGFSILRLEQQTTGPRGFSCSLTTSWKAYERRAGVYLGCFSGHSERRCCSFARGSIRCATGISNRALSWSMVWTRTGFMR